MSIKITAKNVLSRKRLLTGQSKLSALQIRLLMSKVKCKLIVHHTHGLNVLYCWHNSGNIPALGLVIKIIFNRYMSISSFLRVVKVFRSWMHLIFLLKKRSWWLFSAGNKVTSTAHFIRNEIIRQRLWLYIEGNCSHETKFNYGGRRSLCRKSDYSRGIQIISRFVFTC